MAAQSRFSSPAGTRPAGKFVSSSMNGISGGKRRNVRQRRRKLRDQTPCSQAPRGGAPRESGSSLVLQAHRTSRLAAWVATLSVGPWQTTFYGPDFRKSCCPAHRAPAPPPLLHFGFPEQRFSAVDPFRGGLNTLNMHIPIGTFPGSDPNNVTSSEKFF